MADSCTECGCECLKCSSSNDGHHLRAEMAKLCKRLNKSEQRVEELEEQLHELRLSAEKAAEESEKSTTTILEQNRRLKSSYDETLKRNQELEDQILKMADEMQEEREEFEEALHSVCKRLVDATETMNKMEKETVKNRKDCSLVVSLLKCNQSANKDFISQQVDSFPAELKSKLQGELDLPAQSRFRSKSTPNGDQQTNVTKKPSNGRRSFLRRSKSASCDGPGTSPNGHTQNDIAVDPPKKAVQAVYTALGPGKRQPTRI